jgi:uncharacterized low-complexity protein
MLTKEKTVGRELPVALARGSLASLKARFWIETIALATAIACVLALVIATLGAAAGAVAREPESGQPRTQSAVRLQSYEGMLTDAKCGAKHSAAIGKTAADCTLMCVRGGGQFALVNADNVYLLEGDPVVLKRAAGQRVRISGTLRGASISVASVFTT